MLISLCLLIGCSAPVISEKRVELRSARVTFYLADNARESFVIGDVDNINLIIEDDFKSYKKGDKLAIYFNDNRPYLCIKRTLSPTNATGTR